MLVIGSGGAGLRAAIEMFDKNVDVLVVGKCKKRDAHTILATGGINAALGNMDPQDNWQLHAADTILDGGMINDPVAVKLLCQHAPRAVQELADWGARFARLKDGRIRQRFFGAATYRRACFVGDHTGKEILNVLVDQVMGRGIRFRNEVYVFSLLKNKGKVNGAIGLDMRKGRIVVFHAKKVLLATGGHSRMYERSSSRFWENNGDGIALAYGAGADFMDMELFQFHPTGMVWPKEAEGVLVTEAVRGEGGILTNANGERFMENYDKERMELSARDVVARAIYREVEKGNGTQRGGVWLDISHKPRQYILERLPKMYRQFMKYCTVDISKEKMEVAPTAHYSMGGIHVDHTSGKTRVPNLYALGEVTAGVHGGNRLGGNSLAEITVFGRLTGEQMVKDLRKGTLIPLSEKEVLEKTEWLKNKLHDGSGQNPIEVKKGIQQMMWEDVGVVRSGKRMRIALKGIRKFEGVRMKTGKGMKMNEKLMAALDVENMLPTCHMIIESALHRKESRAAHYRTDFRKTDPAWRKNIYCKNTGKGFRISTRPVPGIPEEIRKAMRSKKKRSTKLLE